MALGAAVQAGIYDGQVSDLMVIDVWQASLMRAFARQVEKERAQQAGEQEGAEVEEAMEGQEQEQGADDDDGGESDWGTVDLEEAAAAAAAEQGDEAEEELPT